jgi:hypothetical protein
MGDTATESLQAQIPGAQIIERKPGAPIKFVIVPEVNAATGEQVERSVPTDIGKILRSIEIASAIAIDGAQHLDKTPRPADYVAAFRPVGKRAMELHDEIASWTKFFSDQFSFRGIDISDVEAALATLVDVSASVVREFKALPSRGAPKNTALCHSIQSLRQLFRTHYRGPRTGRRRRGSFQHPGPEETRELAFVETALLDARVIPRDRSRGRLVRLFRDSRCMPILEGGKTVERLASSADRLRREQQHPADQRVAQAPKPGRSPRKKRNR